MARPPIRIGILGAGAMGAVHAAAYATMADVEVVGVYSRSAARAGATAAICRAEPVLEAARLIEDPTIDAVDVCVPTSLHANHVMAALDRGKHVFCETPFAASADEARQMLGAARRARCLLQVGLLMRSAVEYEYVKALTQSGRYGCLLSLSTWRLGSYLRRTGVDHKPHYGDPSTELLTFDFDFIRWVMGMPHRLSAAAVQGEGRSPGEISAVLAFADGRQATAIASGLMPTGSPFTVGFRALFDDAVLRLVTVFEDGPPTVTFTLSDHQRHDQPVGLAPRNPYATELRRFVDCVRGEADPGLLDAERAVEALTLSLATQRSLTEGCTVAIG